MSEFPFSPVDAHDDAPGRDKRTIVLAGGLAAAVLAAGGYFFLGSGGGDDLSEAAPITPTRSSASKTAGTSAASTPAKAAATKVLPAAATIQTGRNPFKVLYRAPAEAAASTGTAVPGVVPAVGTPSTDGTAVVTGGTSESAGGSTPAPPTTASTEYPIRLTSVSAPQGQVRVVTWRIGGKDVEVIPGQKFGSFGELVVLAFPLKADTNYIYKVVKIIYHY